VQPISKIQGRLIQRARAQGPLDKTLDKTLDSNLRGPQTAHALFVIS